MHARTLLHKLFLESSSEIDKRIHKTVLDTSLTLVGCKKLSIASLGRFLLSKTTVKHNIKRMDRLFGNKTLNSKRVNYYKKIAKIIIGNNKRPIIIVDWSGLTKCGEYHFIRASIPVNGRALSIYDKTYLESEYSSHRSHIEFISELKKVLPKNCKPILVTDSGFRCPWFKLIRLSGWDFVGRVRHITLYREEGSTKWFPIKSWLKHTAGQSKYLSSGFLAKANPEYCHVYGYKKNPKNRIKRNLRGKKVRCSLSLRHGKREREPWLIVTSLNREEFNAARIISIYSKRMQIEEGYRDLKNMKNGLSMRECRSFQKSRLNVALLLASIATLMLWLFGMIARTKNRHYQYQANTVRTRNVLSNMTIGWQFFIEKRINPKLKDLYLAIQGFRDAQFI